MAGARGGMIQLQRNGEVMDAKGNFTIGFGLPKREPIIGADGVHGYKDTPQAAFIEGAITDRGTLRLADMFADTDVTVTVTFRNGKAYQLTGGWFAGDGQVTSEEGEVPVRWESDQKLVEIV